MKTFNRKEHWENIYETKPLNEVSWYQPTPETSLHLLRQQSLPLTAKIIDIGGGDSFLVDHLLNEGYRNITVLDISEHAIQRARKRLGALADQVKWIVSDIIDFRSGEKYDYWHDRAAFHFLTNEAEITHYIEIAEQHILLNGILTIGTFSEQGPLKCSGIVIKQYSETSMTERFSHAFEKIRCVTVDHRTPFDTVQHFLFCSFRKR